MKKLQVYEQQFASLHMPVLHQKIVYSYKYLVNLKYFNHYETELFGKKCVLSRTGYSGEKGFELFVSGTDAVAVWDNILEAGKVPPNNTTLKQIQLKIPNFIFIKHMVLTLIWKH